MSKATLDLSQAGLTSMQQSLMYGPDDSHMTAIEKSLYVQIVTNGVVTINGEPDAVRQAEFVIKEMILHIQKHDQMDLDWIMGTVANAIHKSTVPTGNLESINLGKMTVRARNPAQSVLMHLLDTKRLVITAGPAGTGKTFPAVAMAIKALREGKVKRIIITRPAVEAGERLGFLPGDLQSKMDPYMRPIYDAITALVGFEEMEKMIERGIIEIAPLAFMRGRTLVDAFVIADETQNTTIEQARMLVTRLGPGSIMLINGDLMQIDLPKHVRSGLDYLMERLAGISDIAIHRFSNDDIVRDPIVSLCVAAFTDTPSE